MIQFPEKIQIPIINHLSKEEYFLIPAKALDITPERIAEIVAICQQSDIYNNLFKEEFSNAPYSSEHARYWLDLAHKGWSEGTHYVFCTVTKDNRLAASCELEGNRVEGVEIGYWASIEHRGIMSNAVMAILKLAKEAGFRSFMASALHHNLQSKSVLARCGFVEEPEKRDDTYDYFSLSLPLSGEKQTIDIRLLSEADSLEALTALIHRAYKQLADLGFRYWGTHQSVDVTRKRIAQGECYVALCDGEIVGSIVLNFPENISGHDWYDLPEVTSFSQFAVDPQFQKQGIGLQLLRIIEQRAAALGVKELACDTAEGATHLIALYTKQGFRKVDMADWEGTNYKSLILSKTLIELENKN